MSRSWAPVLVGVLLGCSPPHPRPPDAGFGGCSFDRAGFVEPRVMPFSALILVDVSRLGSCVGVPPSDVAPAVLKSVDGTRTGTARIDLLDGRAFASLQVSSPGLYQLDIAWPDGVRQTLFVHAAETRPSPFVDVTFTDRMDSCSSGPYRTQSGLTVCARASGIFAYAANGSFLQTWPGTVVVARGDSIWTWGAGSDPDEVELRDGQGVVLGSGVAGHGGLITPTSVTGLVSDAGLTVVRTLTRVDGGVELSEDATPFVGGIPAQPGGAPFFVVSRDEQNWWLSNCRIAEGCPSAPGQCPVDNRCGAMEPQSQIAVYLVEGDALWGAPRFGFVPRPLTAALLLQGTPRASLLFSSVFAPTPRDVWEAGAAAPGYVLLGVPPAGDRFASVRRRGDEEVFSLLPIDATRPVLTHTREFLTQLKDPRDPFTVRFTVDP